MNKEVRTSLAWGIGIIAVALAASAARSAGQIDQDTVTRIVFGAIGLMVAAFGNRAPKSVAPSACAQQISRVAGWSLALSGLVYAGLWALAPVDVAIVAGCAAILAGMAVTMVYAFRFRADARNKGVS